MNLKFMKGYEFLRDILSVKRSPEDENDIGGELQYCSKDAITPGASNFTSWTRGSYKVGGDNVVYTVAAMAYSYHFPFGEIYH